MRKIGLDVGDKTIGVAVSDELLIAANGITTIERIGIRKDCDKVMALIREYDCDTVVIGLNKMLNGSDSPQTEKVYEFKVMLEKEGKILDMEEHRINVPAGETGTIKIGLSVPESGGEYVLTASAVFSGCL